MCKKKNSNQQCVKQEIKEKSEKAIIKNTISEKDITSWTIDKLKNITSIIDLGVIISVISGLSMLSIFIYKITYMIIIGVPFQLALSVIDIKSIDFIIAFLLLIFLLIMIIGTYYYLYEGTKYNKIISCVSILIVPVIISKMLKFKTYTCVSIELNFIFLIVSLILLIRFHNKRPKKIINNILNHSPSMQQNIVVSFEIIIYIVVLCVYSMLMANIYLSIPTSKSLVVDKGEKKVVVSSSSSELLAANYSLDESTNINKIKIETNSFELVEKGNDPIELNILVNAIFEK